MTQQEASFVPSPSPPKILLTHFDWTLRRMEEVLRNEKTDYFRDAALHRFSLTYDLALKCIRAFALSKGQHCNSTQECWQWVVSNDCGGSEMEWGEMTASYDLVSQKLRDNSADSVYGKLDSYYKGLKQLYEKLAALGDG